MRTSAQLQSAFTDRETAAASDVIAAHVIGMGIGAALVMSLTVFIAVALRGVISG